MGQNGQQNLLTYVIGSCAISLSLYTLFLNRHDFTIAAASIFFILICYTDSRYGKIPNILNACMVVTGLLINTHATGTSGIFTSFSGLALGFALLFLPFLAGGFGAGDVKALAAIGSLVGPYELLHIFAYMAFFGGGLALLFNLCRKQFWYKLKFGLSSVVATVLSKDISNLKSPQGKPRKAFVRFPYATAIAFGYYSFIYWGRII